MFEKISRSVSLISVLSFPFEIAKMSWPLFEAVGLLALILFLLYYYSVSLLQYWEKRGVKGPKPIPFLGTCKDLYLGKCSFNDCIVKAYYEFKDEPLIGMFNGHIPILIVRDPDFMKDVLIKDFSKFADRMTKPNETVRLDSLKNRRNKNIQIK